MGMTDVNDFLLSGGVPWAKFEKHGDSITGTVVKSETRQSRDFLSGEPKTWDNGDPMIEVVITLATDLRDKEVENDDGTRQLVVNKANMKAAIASALRASKSKLDLGGTLTVTYTSDGKPRQKGMSGAKQFEATYAPGTPMSDAEVAAALGADDAPF